MSVWRLWMLLQAFMLCKRSLMIAPSASRKVSGSVGMPSIGAFWTPRKARKGSCSFPGVAFHSAKIAKGTQGMYHYVPLGENRQKGNKVAMEETEPQTSENTTGIFAEKAAAVM